MNESIEKIINLSKKYKVSAYRIAQNTNVSERTVGMILNKEVKRPHKTTIAEILQYLNNLNDDKNQLNTTVPFIAKTDGEFEKEKGLSEKEKNIISNAFLIHPNEVIKLPVVSKWLEAELLLCENNIMREFSKLRKPE